MAAGEQHLQSFSQLLGNFEGLLKELKLSVTNFATKKDEGAYDQFAKGIDYLDVKVQLLLSYCVKIVFYLLLKLEGKPVKDHPLVESLIYTRILLEKLQPLDRKLRYYVDKTIQSAVLGATFQSDPLLYKPNPQSLVSRYSQPTTTDSEDVQGSGVYVPPKISAVYLESEDKNHKVKEQEKRLEKLRATSVYQELREEFSELPKELKDFSAISVGSLFDGHDALKRSQYEEENYIRLPKTKKDKVTQRNVYHRNEYEQLLDFGNFSKLSMDNQKFKSFSPSLKRKDLHPEVRPSRSKNSKKNIRFTYK